MQTLKPCPFCGGSNIRTDIGLSEFHDGEVTCEDCGANVGNHEDMEKAITAWNTRPAAPVEGLEYDRIINHVNSYGTTHEEDPRRIYTKCQLDLAIRLASKTSGTHTKLDELETVVVSYGNDLVSRSQAVAIIAAERAKAEEFADEIKEAAYEVWPEANDVGSDAPDIIRELGKERDACQTEAEDLKNKLYRAEAIIAALTARVKELDDECNELVKTSNEVVGQRDHAMNLCAQMEEEKEALETQLAAAKERETKAFKAGYVLACCNVVHQHDEPTIAHDALAELGVTKAEVKAMNLSEFDMKALRIIERDRATSPYAKRKPKARAALEGQP